MTSPNQKSLEDSVDGDSFAINALKDLTSGTVSESLRKLSLSANNNEEDEDAHVPDTKERTFYLPERAQNSLSTRKEVPKTGSISHNSTYSDITTPPADSAPNSRTAVNEYSKREVDASYSSDFTITATASEEEMTAWERWFVMKHEQLRRQAELEKKKKAEAKQKQEAEDRKKIAENERKLKAWVERKKIEDIQKKEQEKTKEKVKKAETSIDRQRTFEHWFQKKLLEKKSETQYNEQLKKYEEIRKEMRMKKNEKAHKEWMMKAKHRPQTPRVTYGYVGESVIGFYDSTSHPPPNYVNPIPWQQ